MNIPQAIAQVQRLPGLVAESSHVSDAFVIHMLHRLQTARLDSPAMPELLKPVRGLGTVVPFTAVDVPAVQTNGMLLLPETIPTLRRVPWSRSPLEIARAAVAHGLKRTSELQQGMLTQHALLVAGGEFAHEIGLLSTLAQVTMPLKSVVHVPYGRRSPFSWAS